MAKASQSLASMSVDALLKLRDDVGAMLSQKATDLKRQLSQLIGGNSAGHGRKSGRKASLKGRKVAPKYKGPAGELWAGRGATPRWMVEAVKGGAKKDDFLIAKKSSKKVSRKMAPSAAPNQARSPAEVRMRSRNRFVEKPSSVQGEEWWAL